jgi:hypothetical protein
VWGGGRVALAGEQKKVAARILESSQAIKILQHELAAQNILLKSGQVVENQPDWSVILALLPRALSGDVVLRRCELRADRPTSAPASAAAPAASATPTTRPAPAPVDAVAALRDATQAEVRETFLLKVAGCGKSMAAVLQFVQELERTGLFDQVRLIRTSPEALQGLTLTGFQVECSLSGKDEGSK